VPWRAAFAEREGKWCLFPERRAGARFEVGDLRRTMPCGPFDLVLCRNLAFTYFAEPLQQQVLAGIATRLVRGGGLVVGAHERVPETGVFAPWPGARCVYERR
jgi:chemotaxis protein methyltransferase CheR